MLTGRITSGYQALRLGRHSQCNRAYVITFTTKNRKPWFENFWLARIVVNALRTTPKQETFCYVVMPDHVHWLMALTGNHELSKVVWSVKSFSAHSINRFLNQSGSIWQAGFHDRAVRDEDAMIDVARYLVANPIRAGLCDDIGMYSHWDYFDL